MQYYKVTLYKKCHNANITDNSGMSVSGAYTNTWHSCPPSGTPFCPLSAVEMVTKDYYWFMLNFILVEEKYYYIAGILLTFETPAKTSESFLYPLTYFVQRKIFKCLPRRHSFLYGPLNNKKSQFGCVSSVFTMHFIHRSMHTRTCNTDTCNYIYSLADKAMTLCLWNI